MNIKKEQILTVLRLIVKAQSAVQLTDVCVESEECNGCVYSGYCKELTKARENFRAILCNEGVD